MCGELKETPTPESSWIQEEPPGADGKGFLGAEFCIFKRHCTHSSQRMGAWNTMYPALAAPLTQSPRGC